MKTLNSTIKKVGVLANSEKQACAEAEAQACLMLRRAGRVVCLDKATSELATIQKAEIVPNASALARSVELLLVFGGDGTILRVARDIAGSRTPILGINIGSLGFLTAVPLSELALALSHVWNGEYSFEDRALLQASGSSGDSRINQTALNDIVISRGIASRLIELDVHVDDELLTRYRCDGLILSSATGSTAYSLAAGGAVIFPTANVFSITPICPHTLSNRSLIVPLSSKVDIQVISPRPSTILSADGQVINELSAGDRLTVCRSRRTVRLMHLAGSSFCETLRRKLHWRVATL